MVYDFDPYGSKKPKQGKTVDEKYGIGGDYKPEKKERYDSRREKPPEYTPMKEIERSVVASEAMPRVEENRLESLKRMTPLVIGDLFDRVKFLEQRIDELKSLMGTRETIHNEMVNDIDDDIIEKRQMVGVVSDLHERRNLKLDISILRKEKRHENVQFWKDLLELTTELRTLTEQYETESKIVSIFKGMSGVDANAV